MSIPTIEIEEVSVQEVYVPNWIQQQPTVDYLVPPVILNIGNPIVNMPGCVKSHRDNQYHKSGLPLDKNLVEQDPDKVMILCDAQVPSYDAMNYEPERLIITREAPIPVASTRWMNPASLSREVDMQEADRGESSRNYCNV